MTKEHYIEGLPGNLPSSGKVAIIGSIKNVEKDSFEVELNGKSEKVFLKPDIPLPKKRDNCRVFCSNEGDGFVMDFAQELKDFDFNLFERLKKSENKLQG